MNANYYVCEQFIAQQVAGGVRMVYDASKTHAFGEFVANADFVGTDCLVVEYAETDFNDESPYNQRRMTEEVYQQAEAL